LCRRAYFIKALLFPAFSFLPSDSFQVLLAFLYAFRVSFLKVKLLEKKSETFARLFFLAFFFFIALRMLRDPAKLAFFFLKVLKKKKNIRRDIKKEKAKKKKAGRKAF
jgi:hypothetical protein